MATLASMMVRAAGRGVGTRGGGSFRKAATTTRYITGVEEIDAKLRSFEVKVNNKVAYAAALAGGRKAVSQIKKGIPSKHKAIRKAIGVRGKKMGNAGYEVKAGAAVGKARKNDPARTSKGVGISGNNIHWWLMGTGERYHKGGKYTGAMPQMGSVADLVQVQEIRAKIVESATKGIQREIAKIAVRG